MADRLGNGRGPGWRYAGDGRRGPLWLARLFPHGRSMYGSGAAGLLVCSTRFARLENEECEIVWC